MATHNNFSLSTTQATLLTGPENTAGRDITIQNLSIGYVYLGATSGVSNTSFGYRLDPGAAWSVELNGKDSIYAIAENNGAAICVFSLGLER